MSIRIDVREDLMIEVMISSLGRRPKHLKCVGIEKTMILVEYFIKRDLERARGERFIPQIEIEARKAFQQLSKRSPFNGKAT